MTPRDRSILPILTDLLPGARPADAKIIAAWIKSSEEPTWPNRIAGWIVEATGWATALIILSVFAHWIGWAK